MTIFLNTVHCAKNAVKTLQSKYVQEQLFLKENFAMMNFKNLSNIDHILIQSKRYSLEVPLHSRPGINDY